MIEDQSKSSGRQVSRREFITVLGGTCLTVGVLSLAGSACRPGQGRVTLDSGGFTLGQRSFPLYSGGFHYWHHEPRHWPGIFARLSRLGLNTISTPVPWSVHEDRNRKLDFAEPGGSRNLEAFLGLAGERNFKVLLGIGPVTDSDRRGCGVPDRVLFDHRISDRTPDNGFVIHRTSLRQFPVPATCSRNFLRVLGRYLALLVPLIRNYTWDKRGPVIGLEIDTGENIFTALREPFSAGYHPDTVDLYRRFLGRKYDSISELNSVYREGYPSFDVIPAPESFGAREAAQLPRYLDWIEFRRWNQVWTTEQVARMCFEQHLLDVPLFYTVPLDYHVPRRLPVQFESVSLEMPGFQEQPAGAAARTDGDTYSRRYRSSRGVRQYDFRPRFITGYETGDTVRSFSPGDFEYHGFLSLMMGRPEWNCHMSVERSGWLAGAVRNDGRMREEYTGAYRRIYGFIREYRFRRYRRKVDLILLRSRGLDRLEALESLAGGEAALGIPGGFFAESTDYGLDESPLSCSLWAGQTREIIRDVGFDYDTGVARTPMESLAGYRVAIIPTMDFIYQEEVEVLTRFIQSGGLVIFGPARPGLDERMRQSGRVEAFFSQAVRAEIFLEDSDVGASRRAREAGGGNSDISGLIFLESSLQAGDLLKALDLVPDFSRNNSNIQISVHALPGTEDGGRLLFAANTTGRSQASDIFFAGARTFREVGGGEPVRRDGKMRVELSPRSVRVWEVSA